MANKQWQYKMTVIYFIFELALYELLFVIWPVKLFVSFSHKAG